LHASLGRDAADGWPARLSLSWLHEAFRAKPQTLQLPAPHRASGAASFARALYTFGQATHVALLPEGLPFASTHEPASKSGHTLGFVFGSLPSQEVFHVKVLRLGSTTAQRQARVLARSALVEARLHAARILLTDDAIADVGQMFEELTERLWGRPMDARLLAAWPSARLDEPGRWLALLDARASAEYMRDRYDSDWFHNPRAWDYLATPPSFETRDDPSPAEVLKAAADLARGFEEALG